MRMQSAHPAAIQYTPMDQDVDIRMNIIGKEASDRASDSTDSKWTDTESCVTNSKDDEGLFLPEYSRDIEASSATENNTDDALPTTIETPPPGTIIGGVAGVITFVFLLVIYITIWTFLRLVELAFLMKCWDMTAADLPLGWWFLHIFGSIALSVLSIALAKSIAEHRKDVGWTPLIGLVLVLIAPSIMFVFYIGIPSAVSATWAGLTWLAEPAGMSLPEPIGNAVSTAVATAMPTAVLDETGY